MNIIVVYNSKTGFTKKYATYISEELQCDMISLKDSAKKDLSNYHIIYGGWIFGGMIMGLNKVKANTIFAVGSTPLDIIDVNKLKSQNNINELFYMPGGFDFKKHNIFIRFMLKSIKKSTMKKENKTKEEEYMATHLGESFDISDKKYIKPLIDKLKKE